MLKELPSSRKHSKLPPGIHIRHDVPAPAGWFSFSTVYIESEPVAWFGQRRPFSNWTCINEAGTTTWLTFKLAREHAVTSLGALAASAADRQSADAARRRQLRELESAIAILKQRIADELGNRVNASQRTPLEITLLAEIEEIKGQLKLLR